MEDSGLRCDSPPGYNPASASQPQGYVEQNKLDVNTFCTMLGGDVLELHERLPHC